MHSILLLLLLIPTVCSYTQYHADFSHRLIVYMYVNDMYEEPPLSLIERMYKGNEVHIYCKWDEPLQFQNIFQTNYLQLHLMQPNAAYKQYMGRTPEDVYRAFQNNDEYLEGKYLYGQIRDIHLIKMSSHAHACYGISAENGYNLTLKQVEFDTERFIHFIVGICLWAASPILANNIMCAYSLVLGLGIYITGWALVCMALFFVGDYELKSMRPLSRNLKILLNKQPSFMTIFLTVSGHMILRLCRRYNYLWLHDTVRRGHYCVLNMLAYMFILHSSDHTSFVCLFVIILIILPQCWSLCQWIWQFCRNLKCKLHPAGAQNVAEEEPVTDEAAFDDALDYPLEVELDNDVDDAPQYNNDQNNNNDNIIDNNIIENIIDNIIDNNNNSYNNNNNSDRTINKPNRLTRHGPNSIAGGTNSPNDSLSCTLLLYDNESCEESCHSMGPGDPPNNN